MSFDPESKPELRDLLEDVLPPGAGDNCGPKLADVLNWKRKEQSRRTRRRTVLCAISILLALAGTFFWNTRESSRGTAPEIAAPSTPVESTPLVSAAPTLPKPVVIRQIGDDELLALLEGTPTALMEWPNGERTLMLLDHPAAMRQR